MVSFSVKCTGPNPEWATKGIVTTEMFPIKTMDSIAVSCAEGYISGITSTNCVDETEFKPAIPLQCVPGKLQG